MTIRQRLMAIAAVSLFFLLMTSYWHFQTIQDGRETAIGMERNAKLFRAVSELVSQVQQERALVALVDTVDTTTHALAQQRDATDATVPAFTAALQQSKLPGEATHDAAQIAEHLAQLRRQIDQGLAPISSQRQYTDIVDGLLDVEGAICNAKTSKGMGKRMTSLVILETAKERAGLLRSGIGNVLQHDEPVGETQRADLVQLKGEIDANLTSPALVLSSPSEQLLREIRENAAWKEVNRVFGVVLDKVQTGQFGEDSQKFLSAAENQVNDLNGLVTKELGQLTDDLLILHNEATHDVWVTIGSIVAALLISGAVTIYLSRSITRSIKRVADSLQDISEGEGDLTRRLEVRSQDEIGRLARHFNGFVDKIQQVVCQVANSTNTITHSSRQISVTANELATGAERTTLQSTTVAGAAEEMCTNMNSVAASTEQMTVNVRTVASAVEQMTSSIREIAKNAEHASSVVGRATELARSSNTDIGQLGQAADQISKVIEVIQDIAEQTNLLALNATIEAARAGEAGRGFAVVATEVKELAKQTAEATDDIRQRIERIQSSTGDAVRSISQISEVIQQVNEVSRTIASAVEEQSITTQEIARNIAQTTVAVEAVSANVHEMASGTDEISRSITGIDQAAKETSTCASSAHRAGQELAQLAETLQSLVGQFHT